MFDLIALVLPLSLDTFAIAAAIGMAGVSPRQRLRMSLLLASFEARMPLVGIAIGQALGHTIGSVGDYIAGAALLALGGTMTFGGDDDEADRAGTSYARRGSLYSDLASVSASTNSPLASASGFYACQSYGRSCSSPARRSWPHNSVCESVLG